MSEKGISVPRLFGQRHGLAIVHLEDTLKPRTQKIRRNLLGTAFVSILMVWTGLIPRNIFGIQLDSNSPERILWALVVSLLYLNTAFFVNGFLDFSVWCRRIDQVYSEHAEELGSARPEMCK